MAKSKDMQGCRSEKTNLKSQSNWRQSDELSQTYGDNVIRMLHGINLVSHHYGRWSSQMALANNVPSHCFIDRLLKNLFR